MKKLSLDGDIPKIKTVMTPFPHFIDSGASLSEARSLMSAQGFRHLPVQSAGELIGIISAQSLDQPPGSKGTVDDAMSTRVFVVDMDRPLDAVLAHMIEHRVDCALVRHEGKLAGIFTTFDACRVLANALHGSGWSDSDDAA